MNRRLFFKTAFATATPTVPLGVAAYGVFEAGWVEIDRQALPLPHLPHSLSGTTVAFLTDIHHGPYSSLEYISSIVRTTLTLRPDLIVLGGDYSYKDAKYIAPCFEILSGLTAPLGVFGVLGNHDYWHGLSETKLAMRAARITELTNAGRWLGRGGDRFWLGGVDDVWAGRPDVHAAMGECRPGDAGLLISHNPDLVEKMRDGRVGLVLSGHTHGGQAVLPGLGAPFVPSRYGAKYLRGRVEAPTTTVYVSRGLGTVVGPMRYGSRPELTLITLQSA